MQNHTMDAGPHPRSLLATVGGGEGYARFNGRRIISQTGFWGLEARECDETPEPDETRGLGDTPEGCVSRRPRIAFGPGAALPTSALRWP